MRFAKYDTSTCVYLNHIIGSMHQWTKASYKNWNVSAEFKTFLLLSLKIPILSYCFFFRYLVCFSLLVGLYFFCIGWTEKIFWSKFNSLRMHPEAYINFCWQQHNYIFYIPYARNDDDGEGKNKKKLNHRWWECMSGKSVNFVLEDISRTWWKHAISIQIVPILDGANTLPIVHLPKL